jgi:quercetin dioxygenase-like cupin family protein
VLILSSTRIHRISQKQKTFASASPPSAQLYRHKIFKGKAPVMYRHVTTIGALALVGFACSAASAQNAPPTYQADPDVYKVIFEDQNFRVIAATWKAGQTDKPHSHPAGSIAYALADCTLKLTAGDKSIELHPKTGVVTAVPPTASHTATNVGPSDCRTIFIEKK